MKDHATVIRLTVRMLGALPQRMSVSTVPRDLGNNVHKPEVGDIIQTRGRLWTSRELLVDKPSLGLQHSLQEKD